MITVSIYSMTSAGETLAGVNDGRQVGMASGHGLWRTLARAWWNCKRKGIARRARDIARGARKYWRTIRPGLAGVISISLVLSLFALGIWSVIDYPTALQMELDPVVSAINLGACVLLKTSAVAIAAFVAILLFGFFIYNPFFYERARKRDSAMMELWLALRGFREDEDGE